MLETGIPNFDLLLGGGIPRGDTLLVTGPAGSGKTTLGFQTAFHAARRGLKVLYVSTLSEESTSRGMVLGRSLEEFRDIVTGVPVPRDETRRAIYPGLTDQEAAVLRVLGELGEGPAQALVQRTGLRRTDLTRSLDRLVTLGYALKVAEGGKTLYRPLARALGE